MLIEGERELACAMQASVTIRSLFNCSELLSPAGRRLREQVRRAGVPLFSVSEQLFGKIVYRERSDGLLAIAEQPSHTLETLSPAKCPLLVVVEGVEKPGNLGAVLRSADAAGADGVIVCDPSTDVYNPNVVRASLGMVFLVPLAQCATSEAVPWLRERGIRIVAATAHADVPYAEIDLRPPTALVVGSEKSGLSVAWREAATFEIQIPMHGHGRSLNLLAATTVLLFEARRQRGANP